MKYFLVIIESEFQRFHGRKCYLVERDDGLELLQAMNYFTYLCIDDSVPDQTKPEHQVVLRLLRDSKKYLLTYNDVLESCHWDVEEGYREAGTTPMEMPIEFTVERTLMIKHQQ